ncbi:MAG: hypothetical protein OES78_06655 [Chromatiales bacterium]|nr:hypothetical protein [Chromatiales bacterium]MDH3894221.1 hypothetical protein [Chromatiales bacterium]MDH4012815.1 hypothetical protein [Chromatiales bacterium]PLX55753.1 MAG: hypothetical protein C0629_10920 [Chromatiales bacterium]
MSTQSGRTSPTSLAPGVRAGSLARDPGGARRQVWYEIASGASGFLLALFMWGHMLLVGSILLGAKGFNWIAGILEHYFIAQPTVIVVLVLFLVHAVMASRKIPAQLKERKALIRLSRDLKSNTKNAPAMQTGNERFQPHLDSMLWIWQVRTGMIILVLASFHLLLITADVIHATFAGEQGIEAARSMARVGDGLWVVYAILVVCVEFHASVGLYRLAVKWGFGSGLGRETLHRIERVLLWLFLGLGIVVLVVLAGWLPPPLAFLLTG